MAEFGTAEFGAQAGDGASAAMYVIIEGMSDSDSPDAATSVSVRVNTQADGLGSDFTIDSVTLTATDYAGNDATSKIGNASATSTTIDTSEARAGGQWAITAAPVVAGVALSGTKTWRVGTVDGLIKEDLSDASRWSFDEGTTAGLVTAYDADGVTYAVGRADTTDRMTLWRFLPENLPRPCTGVVVVEQTNPNQDINKGFGLCLVPASGRTGARAYLLCDAASTEYMAFCSSAGGVSTQGSNVRKIAYTFSVDASGDININAAAYTGADEETGEYDHDLGLTDPQLAFAAGFNSSSTGSVGTLELAIYSAIYPTP